MWSQDILDAVIAAIPEGSTQADAYDAAYNAALDQGFEPADAQDIAYEVSEPYPS